MKPYFLKRIESVGEAHVFFNKLHADGLLFHCEDDPDSIVGRDGAFLFGPDEVMELRKRIAEVYTYMSDPCAFCNTLDGMNPGTSNKIVLGSHQEATLMETELRHIHRTTCPIMSWVQFMHALVTNKGIDKHEEMMALMDWRRREAGAPASRVPFLLPEEFAQAFYELRRLWQPHEMDLDFKDWLKSESEFGSLHYHKAKAFTELYTRMLGVNMVYKILDSMPEKPTPAGERPVNTSLFKAIGELFRALPAERRLEIMAEYCDGCGGLAPCHCQNDT